MDYSNHQLSEMKTAKEQNLRESKQIPSLNQHISNVDINTIIDHQQWDEVINVIGIDNVDLISELIDNFLSNSEKHIELIKIAIANKSPEELHFSSHTIKGASESLGILKLSEQCQEIEQMARQGDWEKVETLYETLENFYTMAKKALEEKKITLT